MINFIILMLNKRGLSVIPCGTVAIQIKEKKYFHVPNKGRSIWKVALKQLKIKILKLLNLSNKGVWGNLWMEMKETDSDCPREQTNKRQIII